MLSGMNELLRRRPFVPPAVQSDRRLSKAARIAVAEAGRQAEASLAIESLCPSLEQKALFAWFDDEGIVPEERERILIERAKARAP